ncbi:MAG TPA: DoxX family protein [Candidatus Binataceae bacterium]|nr:DoxX family protein [Candidatus Binataceae bacterium]
MESLRDVGALVGRILLALIFVLSGLNKIMNVSGTAGYMLHAGIPANLVHPLLYLSIAIELGCGLLVMAGLQARWAALIIFLWLIPVTLLFHVAGYYQAVQQHQAMVAATQQVMYLKNIAMMGGLLVLAAMGPGRLSVDGRSTVTRLNAPRRAA